jgi:hypothetical protein
MNTAGQQWKVSENPLCDADSHFGVSFLDFPGVVTARTVWMTLAPSTREAILLPL